MSTAAAQSSTSHRPPSPRLSQAQRRDASERGLIEATMEVVATRGASAATFEAVGAAAGYSRGLAAQKFGSKGGLIDAVIGHLHGARQDLLAAERVDDLPALDAIEHFVVSLLHELAHANGGRAYFMLMAAAIADLSPARDAFAESNERVRLWLETVIRTGQARGEIRADVQPAPAALIVGATLLGLGMQWLVAPATDIEETSRLAMATIRRNLSARGDKR